MVPMRAALLCLNLICVLHIGKSALKTEDWMTKNIEWLGILTLKQLCLAGTHNSGMNQITGGTPKAKPCKVLTQDLTVGKQLENGIRYLDLRPVLSEGIFTSGNFMLTEKNKWEGANGQSIESIIEDVNNFTSQYNEFIIINLSHSLNMDGDTEPRKFNQKDWDQLFDLLNSTENLFHSKATLHLETITLGEITNNGSRAGVIYVFYDQGTGVDLGELAGKGFFYHRNLHLFQSESDTHDPLIMIDQQISLMEKVSHNRYFLMSFIISQSPTKVTVCSKRRNHRELAQKTNTKLKGILKYVSNDIHPNIIIVDYLADSNVAEVAMTINVRWLTKTALDSFIKKKAIKWK
ncbi:unnamed protein product [Nezara viridula]|uniref:Phosphatidylinositol-specific phospholipase C X domain-containing protein n=1 Tax=Nezara viridula TaxID=85310 RepID=A0A9P0GYC8_NEZVI|nr:unnamed protein product [Nezara viridula]